MNSQCTSCTSMVPSGPCSSSCLVKAPISGGCRNQRLKSSVSSLPDPVVQLASVDPGLTQTILLGGAMMGSVGFALFSGLKKDPEICKLCGGSGGAKCFACEGSGTMTNVPRDVLNERNVEFMITGGGGDRNRCRACKGSGMIFCRTCRGSGYTNM